MPLGETFIEKLLLVAPELNTVYDEHVADNDMLLPHVFMGDVTRFVVDQASGVRNLSVVQRILDYFETELRSGSTESIELIRASFVENLIGEAMAVDTIKALMGTQLCKEVESIFGN